MLQGLEFANCIPIVSYNMFLSFVSVTDKEAWLESVDFFFFFGKTAL